MTDTNDDVEQRREEMLRALYTGQLAHRIQAISARLRVLADDIEREAVRVGQTPSTGAEIAHDVVHALTWGFANLSQAGVISAAAEYDREVLGGQR
jgi:hypothetical protein